MRQHYYGIKNDVERHRQHLPTRGLKFFLPNPSRPSHQSDCAAIDRLTKRCNVFQSLTRKHYERRSAESSQKSRSFFNMSAIRIALVGLLHDSEPFFGDSTHAKQRKPVAHCRSHGRRRLPWVVIALSQALTLLNKRRLRRSSVRPSGLRYLRLQAPFCGADGRCLAASVFAESAPPRMEVTNSLDSIATLSREVLWRAVERTATLAHWLRRCGSGGRLTRVQRQ